MIEATTDDFIAFEEGKVYTNDSVFRDMDEISPYTAEFKFDNFKMNIDNSSGHISYYERAEFVVRDALRWNFDFIGSAAFRKKDGVWRMYFMHTTRKSPI